MPKIRGQPARSAFSAPAGNVFGLLRQPRPVWLGWHLSARPPGSKLVVLRRSGPGMPAYNQMFSDKTRVFTNGCRILGATRSFLAKPSRLGG